MESSSLEYESLRRLMAFTQQLEDISIQQACIVKAAGELIRAAPQETLLNKLVNEWKSFFDRNDDPSKAQALIYVMNEVIQRKPQILRAVAEPLTSAFADISQRFASVVPSCHRVVDILRQRRCCGPSDNPIYENFTNALAGLSQKPRFSLPPNSATSVFPSTAINTSEDNFLRLATEEATSDEEVETDEEDAWFTENLLEGIKCVDKCVSDIESKYDTRHSLQEQLTNAYSASLPYDDERRKALIESKEKQITRLLVKEWSLRVDLQEEYKEVLSDLQYEIDATINRINLLRTHKTVAQQCRMRRL